MRCLTCNVFALLVTITAILCIPFSRAKVSTSCPTTAVDNSRDHLKAFEVEGQIAQLEWVGLEDQVIYVLSSAGKLYRSGNYGNFWEEETSSGKLKGLDSGQSYDIYEQTGIKQILFHHGRPREIFFIGANGKHWATLDEGNSYIQPCGFELPGDTQCIQHPGGDIARMTNPFMKLHPSKKAWILALVRRDACFGRDSRTSCADDLFMSHDFGTSWTNLTENAKGRIAGFVDFDWADEGPGDDGSNPTILASVYLQRADLDKRRYHDWDKNVDLIRTTDFFVSVKEESMLLCGNAFRIMPPKGGEECQGKGRGEECNVKVFAAVTADCNKEEESYSSHHVQLRVSHDLGRSWHAVCFPVNLEDNSYTILDMTEETAFVCVDHDEEDRLEASAPVGNVYASDASLRMFGLSQKRVLRPRAFAVDFLRVKAVPGTFLSNQVSEDAIEDPALRQGLTAFEDYVQTRVSFSEGASWDFLLAPSVDSEGNKVTCHGDQPCRLHLHGPSSWTKWNQDKWYPSFYSHASAPGVIMAVGNVGTYLEANTDNINTYVSRDAGQTWSEVRKMPHIYEFGDHGGIIVIAEHASSGATDQIWFSRDEGVCWEGPVKLAEAIMIENIRVEPDSHSHVFIAHGSKVDTSGKMVTMLVTIDLRHLLRPEEYPDCRPGDYEYWSPTTKHCLLGMNVTMERRKQGSRCFNGYSYEHRQAGELAPCVCSFHSDVVCEYGFERSDEGGEECVAAGSTEDAFAKCYVDVGDADYRETGERLIDGDRCIFPERVLKALPPGSQGAHYGPGGGSKGGGSKSGMSMGMALLVTLMVMGTAAGGIWVAWTRFGLREMVPDETKQQAQQTWDTISSFVESNLNLDVLRYARMRANFEPLAPGAGDEMFDPVDPSQPGGWA